ncbi:MAG: leucyl aminopeptidase [Betaproteobacteria bacterium]
MQFSTKPLSADRLKAGCAIVPVIVGEPLSGDAQTLDQAQGGRLSAVIARGDLQKKPGSTLMVHLEGALQRVLLVSLGSATEVAEKSFRDASAAAWRALANAAAEDVVSFLHEAAVAQRSLDWKLQVQVLSGRDAPYRFEAMKSRKESTPRRPRQVVFAVPRAQQAAAAVSVSRAQALANGMDFTRDLGNLPPNVCTPTYLADQAKKLAREFGLKLEVLDTKQMQALKMGALLAVAQGSEQPPKMIVLQYNGASSRQQPVALVGKGITFDTGGISIKPAAGMDEMKFDMCGAASVLGTLRAVAEMKLKINVIGVVPACENMPSGRATRPGDIVTSMSGQTVEILNTDAEGRLILCDALTYVERFKPRTVIDIATLTGACVVALGHHHSGLFTPQDALAAELIDAGRDSSDTCWRMPLDDVYQDALKSRFADFANVGGRDGGAITAACFLARFTKKYDWAHLDIAGTAWKSGAAKGASARPVPLLTRFLISRAEG